VALVKKFLDEEMEDRPCMIASFAYGAAFNTSYSKTILSFFLIIGFIATE